MRSLNESRSEHECGVACPYHIDIAMLDGFVRLDM